jgi:single-strand DNA-binding protein
MFQTYVAAGNLGQDIEVKTGASGKAFTNFSIAVTEGFGTDKKTEWINCIAFGGTAEALGKYAKKGSLLIVIGRIANSSHEKDGVKKYYTKVLCNRVQILDKKGTVNEEETQEQTENDDLPF